MVIQIEERIKAEKNWNASLKLGKKEPVRTRPHLSQAKTMPSTLCFLDNALMLKAWHCLLFVAA